MYMGPAGLLKTRIMEGALADLFISANSENVSALGRRVFQQQVLTYNSTYADNKKINQNFSEILLSYFLMINID